jgi:hypothetical protein
VKIAVRFLIFLLLGKVRRMLINGGDWMSNNIWLVIIVVFIVLVLLGVVGVTLR